MMNIIVHSYDANIQQPFSSKAYLCPSGLINHTCGQPLND